MQQLQKAIGNPPYLAISSYACKGLENAVKTVYPWAEHRECFVHLMKNFVKRFQGSVFGRMYPAARTFQPEYHEYLMNKMYAANKKVKPFLEQHHNLLWMRSKFKEEIKCEHITNKGNKPRSKNMWQVQCKTCLAFGHRQSSPKCPCNGPKKRYKRCCYTHAFAIACALYLIYFHLQEESCKAREAIRIR
jgi:hypothetical protein